MKYIKSSVLLFLGSICLVLAQQNLQCYDCDPVSNAASCSNPANTSAPLTNCDVKYNDRGANDTILCVSAYFTFRNEPNNTGIYRGCQLQTANVQNFCEWFREERQTNNVTLVSCRSCNTTGCNTHLFDNVGNVNGITNVTAAFGLLVLCLIFITHF